MWSSQNFLSFLPSAKPHGQHVVFQVRREGGHFKKINFNILNFQPYVQHVVFQVRREEGHFKKINFNISNQFNPEIHYNPDLQIVQNYQL